MTERPISNACNAVWYFNAGKAVATIERLFADAGNTVRDYCILTTNYKCISRGFYNCITIIATIICRIAGFYNNACKAGATTERIISNACNTVRYFNACKSCAPVERFLSNACNAVWYFNAFKAAI